MLTEFIDLETKKAFVRKQACFAKLTDEETDILASLLIEKTIPAGQTIVKEGDLVDSVYLIVKGTAEVQHVYVNPDRTLQVDVIATLGINDAIGLNETGFYSLSGVRTATVVAKTDMEVLFLSVAAFHGFALSYPHVNEVMRKNAESIVDYKS